VTEPAAVPLPCRPRPPTLIPRPPRECRVSAPG
jgi:hypothetical protein